MVSNRLLQDIGSLGMPHLYPTYTLTLTHWWGHLIPVEVVMQHRRSCNNCLSRRVSQWNRCRVTPVLRSAGSKVIAGTRRDRIGGSELAREVNGAAVIQWRTERGFTDICSRRDTNALNSSQLTDSLRTWMQHSKQTPALWTASIELKSLLVSHFLKLCGLLYRSWLCSIVSTSRLLSCMQVFSGSASKFELSVGISCLRRFSFLTLESLSSGSFLCKAEHQEGTAIVWPSSK